MVSMGRVKAKAVANDDGSYALFVRSKNGKPSVAVKFIILEGEGQNETITWFGYFEGGAAAISIKALRTLGLQDDDISEAMIQPLTNDVELTLKQEEYDGKTITKVDFINPIGGGSAIKKESIMTKEEVRGFAAIMKMKMSASKPMQKPQAQQPLPAATDNDDLGF